MKDLYSEEYFENYHQRRLNEYSRKVQEIYNSAIVELTKIAKELDYDPSKPFSFSLFPHTRDKVNILLSDMASRLNINISSGIKNEWLEAAKKNDALVMSVFKNSALTVEQLSVYMNKNLEAMSAFMQRKVSGMKLSDRVWDMTQSFKGEMEMALDIGLGEGNSAALVSQKVRRLLNNPDDLFRRVRNDRGQLVLSKNAKIFHPGQGVYRSSYKNAMRLTRTEINMAYRSSDFERWQQLDFIVGYEVRLSGNHPVPDICDDLKGKYPKDFKFVGWHPQCRCHKVSIMMSPDEFNKSELDILNGDPVDTTSVNTVEGTPAGFNKWIKDNQEKSKGWKSQPYFMKDNPDYVKKAYNKPAPSSLMSGPQKVTVSKPITKEYVEAKTISQAQKWAVDNLGLTWANYKGLHVDVANAMNKSLYDTKLIFPDIKTTALGSAQKHVKDLKIALSDFFRNSERYKSLTNKYGESYTERRLKRTVDAYVPKVGKAIAFSTNYPPISNGEAIFDGSKFRGVFVNESYGKNPELLKKAIEANRTVKWFSNGSSDISFITSHEFGHEIDAYLGIKDLPEFKNYFADLRTKGVNYIADNLSMYGATAGGNVVHLRQEMIAEAWAEYITSDTPRQIARDIGEMILRVFHKNNKAELGTSFDDWKMSILKLLRQ